MHLYQLGQEATTLPIPLQVVESLNEAPESDIVIIAVKNYDLDQVAKSLRQQLGDKEPIVVSLQNGVENQRILPKYFSKTVYGVVCYNAWRDGPGRVGYVKRGYLIIGTPKNDLQSEVKTTFEMLKSGLDCSITDRFQDAVYCKLAINLINGLMALVGFRKRSIESEKILLHMTTRLLYEGVEVLQAAGFREHELGSMPSWREIEAAVDMPESFANPLYDFIVNRVGPTSMTQDLFGGKSSTELESLNGYMLELAHRVGVAMPINHAIVEIARENFRLGFVPIQETDLWEMINNRVSDLEKALKRTVP